jgi:hypothetical protein
LQGVYTVPAKSEQDDRFRRLVERIATSALEGKYQQHWLLHSCREFESFLSRRDLSFFYRGLESLWDLGILRPIAIVRKTEGQEIAESLAPVPGLDEQYWMDVRPLPLTLPRRPPEKSTSKLASEALYHPFQVWQAKLVHHCLKARIATSSALAPARAYLSTARRVRSDNRRALEHLLSSPVLLDSYKLIGVLLDIAPISLPRVTSWIRGGFDEYWPWRRRHDHNRLLEEHVVTPEDFKRWHEDLALSADLIDPLVDWFALTQQVNFEHRQPLENSLSGPRGPARLAQDLYLMAQTLRSYAAEFLGLVLPEENEVRLGPMATANQMNYGSPYVTHGYRRVRRRVAREYGLDSAVRLIWAVEGDTEIGFIQTYFAQVGIDLHDRGIELRSLEGIGGLKSNKLDDGLNAARREEQFVFVTVDDEGDARPRLRALASAGLITAGYRLWTGRCFETANFSNAELAQVATKRLGLPKKYRFTGSELSTASKGAKSIKDAVNTCLRGSGCRLQTGCQWGEQLARWAFSHSAPKALQEGGERPIVSDLLFLFRLVDSGFAETTSHFSVGDSGKLEARPQSM